MFLILELSGATQCIMLSIHLFPLSLDLCLRQISLSVGHFVRG